MFYKGPVHDGDDDQQRADRAKRQLMDGLTLYGLVAVSLMLVCYSLERRSAWWVLGFAGSCLLGSSYGFMQGAWPFGVVEAIWAMVALRRWLLIRTAL